MTAIIYVIYKIELLLVPMPYKRSKNYIYIYKLYAKGIRTLCKNGTIINFYKKNSSAYSLRRRTHSFISFAKLLYYHWQ